MNLELITITTAFIDSINPCAIGVLILLISTMVELIENKKRMLTVGIIYVLVIYITYYLAGLGLIYFIAEMGIAQMISVFIGFLIILAGLIDIKDFFWYGKGFSLQVAPKYTEKFKDLSKKLTYPGIIVLGIFVAAVELPCTGGPYLAITTLLSEKFSLYHALLLGMYNFIFVLPLIIIIIFAYLGTTVLALSNWKTKYRKWMRLATGLLMVGLGIFMILFSNGIV